MLRAARDYAETRAGFAWEIPARYNIGVDVCDKWAAREPDRLAILALDRPSDGLLGGPIEVRFGELHALSNRLANALAARA